MKECVGEIEALLAPIRERKERGYRAHELLVAEQDVSALFAAVEAAKKKLHALRVGFPKDQEDRDDYGEGFVSGLDFVLTEVEDVIASALRGETA